MTARSLAAGLAYRVVTRVPASAVGRARTAGRLASLLEIGYAAVGAPLSGRVVPIASGPAAGLCLVAERRALAWLSGRVERRVQDVVTDRLPAGGVFVDVGASVGFFSLLAARLVGANGHVVALEPQPAAAASLRRNADLNRLTNISVVEAAATSRAGAVVLDGVGTATARIVGGDPQRGLRVAGVALDDVLAAEGRSAPDLVKIDAEGHEPAVLEGMRAVLTARRTVLVVECHGNAREIVAALPDGYTASVLGADVPAASAARAAHLLVAPTPAEEG